VTASKYLATAPEFPVVTLKSLLKIWALLTLAMFGFVITIAALGWTMIKLFPH
jgi:hypothetical protein